MGLGVLNDPKSLNVPGTVGILEVADKCMWELFSKRNCVVNLDKRNSTIGNMRNRRGEEVLSSILNLQVIQMILSTGINPMINLKYREANNSLGQQQPK